MNLKSGILVALVSLLFVSCNDNCITGSKPIPASFFVTFIDETTGENVFENGTFTESDIEVVNVNNEPIPFDFLVDLNVIHVFPTTKAVANNKYIKFVLNNQTTMITKEIESLHAISQSVEECFTTYKVNNLRFPNNDSEVENAIFVVKI
jgi:hypothetical protein